jgi:crossover junction endodeoxyribonuclease RuvC
VPASPAGDPLPSALPPFVILGVDPGLQVTGWGVIGVQDGALFSPACGQIPTDSNHRIEERLHAIFVELCDVITRWRPAEIAVEDPFVGENVRSAFAVGEARAVALLAAAQAGVTASPYPPAEVKLAVTGYGRSDKTQVQELVRMQLGMVEVPDTDHASDALAVALCHYMKRVERDRLERAN